MSAPYKVVRVRQGSEAWHTFRQTHVGSSDAAVIAGESPYTSALELYEEKVGGSGDVPEDLAVRFRIGHHMEGLILDLYEEQTSRKVRRSRVLESRELPWLSASLDGDVPDRGPVEAKWTNSSRWDGGVPSDVVLQVTHQMAVSGTKVADVAVLRRDRLEVHEVGFDPALWAALLEIEQGFVRNLAFRQPPTPDASESARRAILRMFPEETEGMLEPDPEVESVVRLILDGQERLSILETEVEGWKNALRFVLEGHAGIEGPGYKVTYRKNKDSHPVSWDLYAGSLERVVGELLSEFDPENQRGVDIESLKDIYTNTKPGARVLRITGGTKG